jgi:hypothetical protein
MLRDSPAPVVGFVTTGATEANLGYGYPAYGSAI